MDERRCIQCGKVLRDAELYSRWCPTKCYRRYWMARNTPEWDVGFSSKRRKLVNPVDMITEDIAA